MWTTTVYVDRFYDDGFEQPQPWPRMRRWPGDPAEEWLATCEYGDRSEEAYFERVEEAIAWGPARAGIVLVRLGASIEACYSAGDITATDRTDGTGWQFPSWPPASWPDYGGPPEPAWPPGPAISSIATVEWTLGFPDNGAGAGE